jgi:hypothetical protein
VLTRFSIRSVDEALEEIVVCTDAGSVFGREACEDGKERQRAGFFNPLGNAGNPQFGHEDKGAEHAGGVSMRSPPHRRVKGVEQFHSGVEIEVRENEKFSSVSLQAFPELRVVAR